VDDLTGEPLSQREDDRPEVVRRRLLAYQTMTAPVLGYYRDAAAASSSSSNPSLRVAEFRGTQSDQIYPQVKAFLDREVKAFLDRAL